MSNRQNESKTGLDLYEHFPQLGRSCNQIRRMWYLLACPSGFLMIVLLQVRVLVERLVRVVSACCISVLYFSVLYFSQRRKISLSIIFLWLLLLHFFETQNDAAEASGKTESKTSLDFCDHLTKSVRYCNKIGRTWSLLACHKGSPAIFLPQLRLVLECVVSFVSVCCINMLYVCCNVFVLYFSRERNQLITGKRKLKNENQHGRTF